MKKTILIVLVILIAALSIASDTLPTPRQRLSGTLQWSRNSTCMIPDFVSLPVMDKVYLLGKGFPTQGQNQGCRIDAVGSYVNTGTAANTCKVFLVDSAVYTCPRPVPSIKFP